MARTSSDIGAGKIKIQKTHYNTLRSDVFSRCLSGTFAARPAAADEGLLYWATDTEELWRDTGSAWVKIAEFIDFSMVPSADNLVASDDTAESTTSDSYVKLKEFTVYVPGEFTIKFDIKRTTGTSAQGKIYKNGSPVGTERSTTSTSYVTFEEDLSGWTNDDKLQLYIKSSNSGHAVWCQNFRVYAVVKAVA